jgi:hypothetical protein
MPRSLEPMPHIERWTCTCQWYREWTPRNTGRRVYGHKLYGTLSEADLRELDIAAHNCAAHQEAVRKMIQRRVGSGAWAQGLW